MNTWLQVVGACDELLGWLLQFSAVVSCIVAVADCYNCCLYSLHRSLSLLKTMISISMAAVAANVNTSYMYMW